MRVPRAILAGSEALPRPGEVVLVGRCATCGVLFRPERRSRAYCGPNCRVRAYRKRVSASSA